jgi:hypothetical protein
MEFRDLPTQKPPVDCIVLRILSCLALFACSFLIREPFGWSQTAQMSWDANSEQDLNGYKIYYGMASRTYDQSMDVGPVVNYDVTGLLPGVIYYFAVTAHNNSGSESGYSNEATYVSGTVPIVTGPVATVVITPGSAAIQTGFNQQFAAVAKDAQLIQLIDVGFTWTSSDPTVATISGTGLATSLSAGSAVITASSNGVVSNQAFLQVTSIPLAVPPGEVTTTPIESGPAAIEASPSSASIAEGSGQQFAAIVKDAQGVQLSGINLTWLSSNTDVAGIDGAGLATAVSSGTTEVFAMNGPVSSNRIALQVVRAQQSYKMSGGGCGFIRMKGGRLPNTRQIATNLILLFAPLLVRAFYKRRRQITRMRREYWLEPFGVWNGLRVAAVSLGVFLFAVMTQEVFIFFSTVI